MNILIKLTCLIGLVLAPILGNGHESDAKDVTKTECCSDKSGKATCSKVETEKKCDLSECSKMNKEECKVMCIEKGCSEEETAMCLSNYDTEGNWIDSKK